MDASETEPLHVTVDVWHPRCWTLRATRDADGGLFGHGMTVSGTGAAERFTAYGASAAAVEELVATVRRSDLTEAVTAVPSSSPATTALAPATRDLLVEFDPGPSIRDAFSARGFVHSGPTWHEGGRERRTLLARTARPSLRRAFEDIETAHGADIEVTRLASAAASEDTAASPFVRLSPRQRETFQLARSRGYYERPRGVTVRELAAELGVSKSTCCEHLRKAESKLLTSVTLG